MEPANLSLIQINSVPFPGSRQASKLKDALASKILTDNLEANGKDRNFFLKERWDELRNDKACPLLLKNKMHEIEESVLLMDESIAIDRILREEESLMWVFNSILDKPPILTKTIRKYLPLITPDDKKQLLEERVDHLYRKLADQFEAKSTFREVIPVSLESYDYLLKDWDESLMKIWEAGILPQLGDGAPQLNTADEIRNWFAKNSDQLDQITQLKVYGCQLKVIPPEITFLKGLRTLDLKINQIKFIPEWILKQDSLVFLYLDNNQIEIIPEFMTQLPFLGHFTFNNNPIKCLPQSYDPNAREIFNVNKVISNYLYGIKWFN